MSPVPTPLVIFHSGQTIRVDHSTSLHSHGARTIWHHGTMARNATFITRSLSGQTL